MKYFLLIITLTFSLIFYAQDGISPLTVNPDLFDKKEKNLEKVLSNSFDSTFFYITDTIALPFFDDFSRNNFQKYTAEINDTDLTEKLYYRMLDENTQIPLNPNTQLTSIKTYRSEYNVVLDTTVLYYFDSIPFLFDDLKKYAPNYTSTFGYPPYNILDTITETGTSRDTVWLLDKINFKQDSARIFLKFLNNPEKLWLNEQAYHNYRFAVNPWSLGVVTFDGLDEYGYPYNFGGISNAYNDTLLAKPIDLSVNFPSDSIYFSFLFQKEGFGDLPEEQGDQSDSLILEFYSPETNLWERVWRTNGGQTTDFQVAHLSIVKPEYFHKGFQFRFINYGSPAGALDHFHIDYVHLRESSGIQDTLFKDFAIVYPISTLLKDYISVPWEHYRKHAGNKMGDSVRVTVRNGSELTENNQSGQVIIYYEGNQEGNFTLNASTLSGGDINYAPRTTYESFHDFSSAYFFDTTINSDTLAHFDYVGIASAQFPNNPINDTTFGQQVFENYYAYDDGTAEKAYGVTGIQGLLAYKFKAYQPDSLIAVKIHFVPSVVDVSNNIFLLTVWEDNNGKPGQIIYQDMAIYPQQPVYTNNTNKFHTYFFKDTMKVGVDSVFYIGMRQIEEPRLNIGFDANNDNSDKIFWSVDGGNKWYNASYPGSIMIRPVISSKMDAMLGLPEQKIKISDFDFTIYPNPGNSMVYVDAENHSSKTVYEIIDLNGRLIKRFTPQILSPTMIDVSGLQRGLYLISRIEQKQIVKVNKLLIQ